jgi:hypothetical protein
MKAILIASTMLALSTAGAQAASITTGYSNGVPTITISGEIVLGDETRFDRLNFSSRMFVYLDSVGGNTSAGLAIANNIWARRLETVVATRCTSMCAIIWLAGSVRWVFSGAHIGFHAIYIADERTGKTRISPGGNAVVGAFLGKLGFSDLTIRRLTEAEPDSMYWLTYEEAKELGIVAKSITKGSSS